MSSAVPRNRRIFASTRNAVSIHGPYVDLRRLAGRRVGLVQRRRREVEAELVVAFELRGDALREIGLGVQARDFVLVLDREQLEVVARDRFGERR